MLEYDPRSSTPIQLTASLIVKIMSSPPEAEVAFHMNGPIPDDLKMPEHWTAKLLVKALLSDFEDSSTVILDSLELLHAEAFNMLVPGVPGGYELTPRGKVEAERLGGHAVVIR